MPESYDGYASFREWVQTDAAADAAAFAMRDTDTMLNGEHGRPYMVRSHRDYQTVFYAALWRVLREFESSDQEESGV